MKATAYQPGSGQLWDRVVRGGVKPHLLFERQYMEYHSDRFEDASVVLTSDRGTFAVFPANVTGDTVESHGGLTFGGLIYRPGSRVSEVAAAIHAVLAHLADLGATRLVYKAIPYTYSVQPSEEDLYVLVQRGARLVRRDLTSTLDLRAGYSYSSSRQRGVKKAQREGVVVSESDRWPEYWDVLVQNLSDVHGTVPTHTLEEIELLHRRFPNRIRLFAANLKGRLLAGVVAYETPMVAHAQYIASSPYGKATGALDLVFDHLIRFYAMEKKPYFDFGISTEEQGRVLNEGLAHYKEGFGARAVAHDFYELSIR